MATSFDHGGGIIGAQSIGRAAELLRLVSERRTMGATLAELGAATRLPKPTVRRMLLALIESGLVEQDDVSRRYYLGPEAYVLGRLAAERFCVHRLADEGVVRIAKLTGDVAFLQIRRQWSVVCLQREDGDFPIRSNALLAGDRHPLGVGAGGLSLLAAMSDDDVERALDTNRPILVERYPVFDRARILDLVAEARGLGFAINRGLYAPGCWGIGVAVRDGNGRPAACLSLSAIESRMHPSRRSVLAAMLQEEAKRLEAKLGWAG